MSFLTAVFIFLTTWLLIIITSTSDLQPSTAILNQSLGKPVSTNSNHTDTTTYL